MRIGFIGSLPPASVLPEEAIRPRNRGGSHPAPWMVALLPALGRLAGHQLRVFLIHRSIQKRCVVTHGGVEYEGIPSPVPERFGRKTLYHQYSLAARRAVRAYAPDLIHAFGFETGSALIALRTGFPVSCFIQGIAEDYFPYYRKSRDWMDRNVGRWGEAAAVKRVRWMVAETGYAADWARRRHPGCHVALIPHPLRMEFVEKGDPSFGNTILSVGSLDDRKGMDTIIRALAAARDPETRLVLVGGGPRRESLGALAAELGVAERVEFCGPLPTEQVIGHMNRARAFVIASRVDTSPNVLSEAHGIGLPVIGTDGGGIAEMIDEGKDGFVVDVDDHLTMARRIDELVADPERARAMGRAGREKVQVLNSPDRIAQLHVEFFDHIGRELGL